MGSSGTNDEDAILEGSAGLFGLIINLLLLWILVGYRKLKTTESNEKSKKLIMIHYLAVIAIVAGILFCSSQTFFLQNVLISHNLSRIQCEFFWRWTYLWWTIQRYFIYMFCFIRLKLVLQGNSMMVFPKKFFKRFMIFITCLQFCVTVCWCIFYTIAPSKLDKYTRCEPEIGGGTLQFMINAIVIFIDFLVGFGCVIYFAIKICKLRSLAMLSNNKMADNQLKDLATRILLSAVIAITSTLIFIIMSSVSQKLGKLLPLDSCFNSFAVIISFNFEWKIFGKYVCWPRYWIQLKTEANVKNNLGQFDETPDKEGQSGKVQTSERDSRSPPAETPSAINVLRVNSTSPTPETPISGSNTDGKNNDKSESPVHVSSYDAYSATRNTPKSTDTNERVSVLEMENTDTKHVTTAILH